MFASRILENTPDTITGADSRSEFVGSNRCEETCSSLGRHAAIGLDSSYIACGSFSSNGFFIFAMSQRKIQCSRGSTFATCDWVGSVVEALGTTHRCLPRPAFNSSSNSSRRCHQIKSCPFPSSLEQKTISHTHHIVFQQYA